MKILIFLLVATLSEYTYANEYRQMALNLHTAQVLETTLTLAPYVTLIDDEDAIRKAGAILVSNLVSLGVTFGTRGSTSPFAISAFTSAGALCTMQSKGECAAGLLVASSVSLLRFSARRTTLKKLSYGIGLGLASGMIVPGLFVSF